MTWTLQVRSPRSTSGRTLCSAVPPQPSWVPDAPALVRNAVDAILGVAL